MPVFLRHPHLHDDTLVLVAQDDVWTVPVVGGRAYRLTADEVPVSAPRISPDGSSVAWASRRDGAWEVYRTGVEGGGVQRLTWWGDPSTRAAGWTPDGAVVALSAHDDPTSRTWAHAVPATGGTPRRLPYGSLTALAHQPDGPAVLTQVEGARDAAHWKRYRGGRAGRLWLDADGSGEFTRVLSDLDGQLECPMIVDTADGPRLAFVSDHEGWGNVYSVPLGTATADGLRRHTDHGAGGEAPDFYARHATTDGRRVVYECAGEIFLLDDLGAASRPRRIEIRLGGPRSARDPFRAAIPGDLGPVRPDRTGRASIVGVRGTVHRLTHRDGPARALLAEPGVRARLAHPLDDHRAVWVDDAEGEDAVCVAPLDAHAPEAAERVRYAAGQLGRVLELVPAPDGTAVALTTHDGRLLVLHTGSAPEQPGNASDDDPDDGVVDDAPDDAAPDAGELRELARGGAGEPFDLAWSPDSAWLAWCDPTEAGLSRVLLTRVADGEHVEVTPARFHDSDPVFTADGRHLAFLSRRVFDPAYDQHSFDLTFGTGWKPFLVPLAARTPSPFGESPKGRPVDSADEGPEDPPAAPPEPAPDDDGDGATTSADPAPAGAAPASGSKPGRGGKAEDGDPPEVVVDADGIADRVVGIPVEAARYHGLTPVSGGLVWLRLPGGGVLGDSLAGEDAERERAVLERFDLARRSVTVIADPASGFAVSGDGTRIVVRDHGKVRLLRADRSSSSAPDGDGGGDEFEIDTRRLVVTIDPSTEWRQMFDETARLMRDHFWVEDMAGVDWAAETARYRPLVDRVGSHDDLLDLLWELHGELGTSHAYVIGTRPAGDGTGRPGLLGADLEPVAGGPGWRITRVLPPETSAPAARSPLSAPGVDVRAGDVLLEVGGAPVDPHWGAAPLLVSAAGRTVELTVRSGPDREDAGTVRRVAVRPLHSDTELRYQDRVARLRSEVAERSGGRLGYLHVPDMMGYGWAQLHRDLARETAKDGLVLDVRGNRGGHTSQLVVEKLARTVIGWDLPRHRAPSTYPEQAPRGPVVALADERSGSDGDIVTAAIKRLGIGPVVGVRTWGGVIGIDGRYGLVDGTRITQPRYATWFDDLGWGMENHGVAPDVEVVVTPQDRAAGRDPQLDRAIELALARLAEHPPARPPDVATRPSMARPALPARPGGGDRRHTP
ncbi:S41 family peptidase [Pseudonocardia parietis]|uniref:Tricorn protease homolog n=1 Tax=Pseudonocardia parietis TaxID=570936 RepID=A0ABS4W470_9PSEU|nr:S41 family peptidase [Pseudonocardia parietis]MBP2370945.1 tricorn protease [Pseudonocardia parietis]